MALAVAVRFDMIDNKGKTSFTKVRIPTGFTIAAYTDFAQQMAQLISNVTQCQITRASFCVGLDLSGGTFKAVANALSDIAQKGFIGFSTAVAGLRTKIKLPALDETVVLSGSDALDQANANVAALLTGFENGITVTGGTISPTDMRQNDITTTDYARELFRKK